ncbi:MAG: peptidylprolyl isomerase [Coriobacteriia bacterium]|nr:peptidylprolyl isomerase [Coriobacteriia bacterium]
MRMFRILIAFVLVAGLALSATGCSSNDVAARVNGEVIKRSELDSQVEKLKDQYPDMFTGADGEGRLLDFKQRLLDNLINAALVRQAANDRGVKVSDADVKSKLDELKAGFADDAQFEAALTQAGMSVDELSDQVREQLVTELLLADINKDVEVVETEIAEYYEANKAQFTEQAAVRASHILFDEADKATAESVLAEIKAGGDFRALAKQHSKDVATAVEGGDLGWPSTPFVPEFQTAADSLDVGEISDLVQTQYGWHIITVTDKRELREKPLAEVREQIEQIIVQQRNADAYQKFLDELRADAEIEILVPELQMPASGAPAE